MTLMTFHFFGTPSCHYCCSIAQAGILILMGRTPSIGISVKELKTVGHNIRKLIIPRKAFFLCVTLSKTYHGSKQRQYQ
jgi:hypothetical protein